MSFMTIPTSHTSYRRNQVKSRNHGKTHIFQHQKDKTKTSSRNNQSKRRKESKFEPVASN